MFIKEEHSITKENGLCSFEAKNLDDTPLIVKKEEDISFIPYVNCFVSNPSNVSWYVFDDRSIYRPKEKVTVKGYVKNYYFFFSKDFLFQLFIFNKKKSKKIQLREIKRNEKGGIALFNCSGEIHYVVFDKSKKLEEGNLTLNKFGSFHLEFDLKKNVRLGNASVIFRYHDRSYTHQFKIIKFKKPKFEVVSYSLPLSDHVCSNKDKLVFTSVVIAVKNINNYKLIYFIFFIIFLRNWFLVNLWKMQE